MRTSQPKRPFLKNLIRFLDLFFGSGNPDFYGSQIFGIFLIKMLIRDRRISNRFKFFRISQYSKNHSGNQEIIEKHRAFQVSVWKSLEKHWFFNVSWPKTLKNQWFSMFGGEIHWKTNCFGTPDLKLTMFSNDSGTKTLKNKLFSHSKLKKHNDFQWFSG